MEVVDVEYEGVADGDEYVTVGLRLWERVWVMDGLPLTLRVWDAVQLREGREGLLVAVHDIEETVGDGLELWNDGVAVRDLVKGAVELRVWVCEGLHSRERETEAV